MKITREQADRATIEADCWPPILAIDPGSQSTGLCLRAGTAPVMAATVERVGDTGHHAALAAWAGQNLAAIRELRRLSRDALNDAAAERGERPEAVRYAVETLVPPSGTRAKGSRVAVAPTVLASLPGAAVVLGAVVTAWPRVILVPPRGTGADGSSGWDGLPRDLYPPVLRGRTPLGWPEPAPGAARSHQRSAWAIAGVAHALAALEPAANGPASSTPASAPASALQEAIRAALSGLPSEPPSAGQPGRALTAVRAAIQQTGTAGALAGREALLAAAWAARSAASREAASEAAKAIRAAVEAVLTEEGAPA